jgi:hypothetical protein
VTRVIDQDAAFLHFVEQRQLMPGQPVTIEHRETAADSVSLRVGSGSITVGAKAASKVLVRPA